MADPRATVDFTEINSHYTTYKAHSGIVATDFDTIAKQDLGLAVAVVANATVGKGSAGNRLRGKAVLYENDGFVSVQDRGYATFKYTGTAPSLRASVACHGDGTVEAASANGDNEVISVDTTAGTCVVDLK